MYSVPWVIDFAFDYPAGCTPAQLRALLQMQAVVWPGWPHFPWRVTRSIHEFLGQPPVNFHYLMIHRCLTGFASHLVLTSRFEDRDAVLAMMIRERFEVVGVLRVLLIDALRYEMRFSKLPYILDCSGPEDGHVHLTPEELTKRRKDFQESIEGAEREFVRILNLASLTGNMNQWVLGRPLQAWARGGDMPERVTLDVQVDERESGKVLRPQPSEVVAIAQAGKPVPEVLVERKKAVGCRLKAEGERDSTAKDAMGREGGAGGEKVIGDQSSVSSESVGGASVGHAGGETVSVRGRKKKVEAGRDRAVVKDKRDRKAIRAAVKQLVKLGLSQREACRQVAEQATKGRAGDWKLSMKYDIGASEATASVVRRVVLARW